MISAGLIIGPAIGGLLLAHFGILVTFLIDFATYGFSLCMIFILGEIPKSVCKVEQSAWSSLKEGFQYAFSRQELIGTYVVDIIAMIFGMPMALFPAIAHLHGGPKTLGLCIQRRQWVLC